jgi:hypothetical protein
LCVVIGGQTCLLLFEKRMSIIKHYGKKAEDRVCGSLLPRHYPGESKTEDFQG